MAAMDHVRYLVQTIGPRGSTTPREAEAARYAVRILSEGGLQPISEAFTSGRSAWHPYALFSGLLLLSELSFWLGGRCGAIAALTSGLVALGSVLLELAFRPNPLRWVLPKGRSQNVWVRLQPRDQPRTQVVLLGHLDSHRTPLAFSTHRWLMVFNSLVPAGLISSVLLVVLFAVGVATGGWLWRAVSVPLGLVALALLLLTLQADLTPYSAGANDNATGAGIVRSTAERLRKEPLGHITVWAVLSGCEEVGCYGAEAFAQAHEDDLGRAIWIALDSMGSTDASPSYLTRETFLLTAHSDPGLLALASQVASRHPELGARARTFSGAYTEGSIGAKHGFRVLTLTSHPCPQWHRPTDVVDNLDPEVLGRSEAFLWELLQGIDRQAGQDA